MVNKLTGLTSLVISLDRDPTFNRLRHKLQKEKTFPVL